ncbi:MAG: amidohydrolase family protein [Firmicutes bacterium]|nr:amidohydrolase family protein [Bacillota bacterium]
MIVDFHVHCFPDDLAKRAIPKLEERAGIAASYDGTLSGLKCSMSEARIDCAVIQSIATKPAQTKAINDWSAAIQNNAVQNGEAQNVEMQNARIVAFGSIHPDYSDWKDELKRIKDLGLRGLKYHPDYQEFFVDEKRMLPIYEEIFKLDLILLFHAGLDIGLPEPYHCTPKRLLNVLRACPGGKIIAAHMGGFKCWDDVEKYLMGEDIYFDTSYGIGWMNDIQAKKIIANHGYEKILFATDAPWALQKEEVDRFRKLGLEDNIRDAILGGNACRLLGHSVNH